MDLDELDDLTPHGDEHESLNDLDRGSDFTGELPDVEDGAAALAREKAEEDARKQAEEDAKTQAAEKKAEEDKAAVPEKKDDKPEGEADPEPKDAARDPMIPKARFDEVARKAREREAELQAELAAERAKHAVTASSETVKALQGEIDRLDAAYAAALKDGETDDAAKLMKDIRAKERELAKAETGVESQNVAVAQAQAAEQAVFDLTLKGFEEQYPEMNPDPANDAYDQAKVDAIVTLMQGYVAAGQPRTAALKAAMALLAPTLKGHTAPVTDAKTDKQKEVEAERRAAAAKKTAQALEAQPASLKDAGLDSHKAGGGIDEAAIDKMSEEEFDALPDSVKARMRGDAF